VKRDGDMEKERQTDRTSERHGGSVVERE